MENEFKVLGRKVKFLRLEKGISQTDMAEAIGLSQTNLSNMESGRTAITIQNLTMQFGEKNVLGYCNSCSNCLNNDELRDYTIEAQKILSCIKRTGERFGKKMICDILRGSKNEKIIRLGLDTQTTYGLMKEYKESQVKDIIDFLEFEGYILSVGNEYPTLTITNKAAAVLFGDEAIVMKQAKPKVSAKKKSKK